MVLFRHTGTLSMVLFICWYVPFGIITRIANQGAVLGRRVAVSDVYLQYSIYRYS